jgi:hypothetical protein
MKARVGSSSGQLGKRAFACRSASMRSWQPSEGTTRVLASFGAPRGSRRQGAEGAEGSAMDPPVDPPCTCQPARTRLRASENAPAEREKERLPSGEHASFSRVDVGHLLKLVEPNQRTASKRFTVVATSATMSRPSSF